MNPRPIELVLQRLRDADRTPRKQGDEWIARCPAHEDDTASLCIGENENGDALLCCQAGCDTKAVVAALSLKMSDLFVGTAKLSGSSKRAKKGPIVATYDYRDEIGAVLFQSVRHDPKDFSQRRPDGSGGWVWKLGNVRRVLYRLPDLIAAPPGSQVFVVEGEKDVDRLTAAGLIATTNPQGAGKWRFVDGSPLHGRRVVLIPDNDEPGGDCVHDIARSLHGKAADVRIVELPGVPSKGDVSDYLDAHAVEELLALVESTSAWNPSPPTATQSGEGGGGGDEKQERKDSQATVLVHMAEGAELFHDPDGGGFATIRIGCHNETWPLRSKKFKNWLGARYFAVTGKAPNAQSLHDALGVLDGRAMFDGHEHAVHVRLAEHGGAIYLDLADSEWRAIEITATGYRVVDDAPVKFRRNNGMLPLPIPLAGGSISELRSFVNVGDDSQWTLFVAPLIASFRPRGPYPILAVHGEQGSAKTTLCRVFRSLIDPNLAPLRSPPRSEDDLLIAAKKSWLVGFDNLSGLSESLADALCRVSTGAGFGKRELFSDDDEVLFSGQRPILVNAIGELSNRSDLLDRVVRLDLPQIADDQRRDERSFWIEFDAARPRVLGAILDAVVVALRNVDSVRLERLPRMADFALWTAAAEPALPWKPGGFVAAYAGNRTATHELALEDSPVATALRAWFEQEGTERWEGPAGELLAILTARVDEKTRQDRSWPKRANQLSGILTRVAPNLRASAKIDFSRPPRGAKGVRTVILRKCGHEAATLATHRHRLLSAAENADSGGDHSVAGGDACGDPDLSRTTFSPSKTQGGDGGDAPQLCSDDGSDRLEREAIMSVEGEAERAANVSGRTWEPAGRRGEAAI